MRGFQWSAERRSQVIIEEGRIPLLREGGVDAT